VLLLLIVGIGSALKAPSTTAEQPSSSEKSINLSGNDASDQANATACAGSLCRADCCRTPRQHAAGCFSAAHLFYASGPGAQAAGQQRVEVQGDLNNALTQPQNQAQIDNAVELYAAN
jgi:DamX protein